MGRKRLILILLFLIALPIVFAENIVLQPDATSGIDTYVYSNADTNYGTSQTLYFGQQGTTFTQTLLKFNLSSISQKSYINSGTIELTYTSSCTGTIYTYNITSYWNESDVVWSTKPTYDKSEINISSCLFLSTIRTNISLPSFILNQWLNNDAENNGIMINRTPSSASTFPVDSSDYTTASYRPKIFLTYFPYISIRKPLNNTIQTNNNTVTFNISTYHPYNDTIWVSFLNTSGYVSQQLCQASPPSDPCLKYEGSFKLPYGTTQLTFWANGSGDIRVNDTVIVSIYNQTIISNGSNSKDKWVYNDYNYGTSPLRFSPSLYQTDLFFNLSQFNNIKVETANLYIYYYSSSNNFNFNTNSFRLTATINETNSIKTPYNSSVIYSTQNFISSSFNIWKIWNLTNLVNIWTNLTEINYGVGLISSDTPDVNDVAWCYSFESSIYRPYINITFIVNNPPYLTNITVTPSLATATSNLNCSAYAMDFENQTLQVNFTWWRNGAINTSFNSLVYGANNTYISTLSLVNSTFLKTGDNWTCSVNAYDGTYWSGWQNSTPKYINLTSTVYPIKPDNMSWTSSHFVNFTCNFSSTSGVKNISLWTNVSYSPFVTTTYTSNGITNPSSTHTFYNGTYDDADPSSTLAMNDEAEFTTTQYDEVKASDDSKASRDCIDVATNSGKFPSFKFNFSINENTADITYLTFTFEGYASYESGGGSAYGIFLYAWNYTEGKWLKIANNTASSDYTEVWTTYSPSDFVDNDKKVLFIALPNGSNQGCAVGAFLYADYAGLSVTTGTGTNQLALNATNHVEGLFNKTYFDTNMSDGSYEWYCKGEDNNGVITESSHYTLGVDTVIPLSNITIPSNHTGYAVNTANLFYTYTEAYLNNCSLYIDNGINETHYSAATCPSPCSYYLGTPTGTDFFKLSMTINTTYNWKVVCVDLAGNTNTTDNRYIRYEHPPDFRETQTLNYTGIDYIKYLMHGNITIRANISDGNNNTDKVRISIDCLNAACAEDLINATMLRIGESKDPIYPYNHTYTDMNYTGEYRTTIIANDTWGITNTTTFSFYVTPALRLVTPPDNSIIRNGTKIEWAVEGVELLSTFYWSNSSGKLNITSYSPFSDFKINTSSWSDGPVAVDVWANDTSGSSTDHRVVNYIIDGTRPTVLLNTTNGTIQNQNIKLFYWVVDANPLNCSLWTNISSTWSFIENKNNITNSTLQNFTFTNTNTTDMVWGVECFDAAGNSNFSVNNTLIIDNYFPIITIQTPINASSRNYHNISVNYTISEKNISQCWYQNTSGINVSIPLCKNFTINLTAEGLYNITLFSNDSAGNTNQTQVFFRLDTTTPNGSFVLPSTAFLPSKNVSINISITEPYLDKCWYQNISGNINVSMNCYTNTTLWADDGSWTVIAFFNDTAGNTNSTSASFTVDTIFPIINISSPLDTTYNSLTNIATNSVITDTNLDVCWYYVFYYLTGTPHTDYTALSCNTNTTVSVTAYTEYQLKMYANDSANNIIQADRHFITSPPGGGGDGGGGGGGGGATQQEVLSKANEWSLTTLQGGDSINIFLSKDSVRPRTQTVKVTNKGPSSLNVNIVCSNKNITQIRKFDKNLNMCDYVSLSNTSFSIEPNNQKGIELKIYVTTPPNSSYGDTYYFNLQALSVVNQTSETIEKQISQLSVSSSVSILGIFFKWSEIPLQRLKPEYKPFQFYTMIPASLVAFLVFLILFLSLKRRMLLGAFFLGLIMAIISLISLLFIL